MKVSIDAGKCQGHGMCNLICPAVFSHDIEGFGVVTADMEDVPRKLEENVRLAEIQCPERAIVTEV